MRRSGWLCLLLLAALHPVSSRAQSSRSGGFVGSSVAPGVVANPALGHFYFRFGRYTNVVDVSAGYSAVANFADGSPPRQVFNSSSSMQQGPPSATPDQEFEAGADLGSQEHCFGPGTVTPALYADGSTFYGPSSFPDATTGTTVCGVAQVNPDGSFSPVPNAVISMVSSSGGAVPVDATAAIRPVNGVNVSYAVFGKSRSNGETVDGPYPSGLASDTYHFTVTAPGFKPVTSYDAAGSPGFRTGSDWVGQGYFLVLAPTSSPNPSTGSGTPPPAIVPGGAWPPSSGACVAVTYAPAPSDGGGSNFGQGNWTDPAFPSYVQPAFLHGSSWHVSLTVAVAGAYSITGDCATNGNMGVLTMSTGGQTGTPVNTTLGTGGIQKASFGTFNLLAGANQLDIALTGQQYAVVKTFYATPTASCGPPAGTGTGTGGTGGGGLAGVGDFFTTFWDKLLKFFQDMFTLQQADIDAVKASTGRLSSYGPLSLPSQIKGEWDNAFGDGYGGFGSGSDPDYWVVHLVQPFESFGSGPKGYENATPPTPLAGTIFNKMFPTQLDLTPYHSFILTGRTLCLVLLWLSVFLALLKRFTPDLRV